MSPFTTRVARNLAWGWLLVAGGCSRTPPGAQAPGIAPTLTNPPAARPVISQGGGRLLGKAKHPAGPPGY